MSSGQVKYLRISAVRAGTALFSAFAIALSACATPSPSTGDIDGKPHQYTDAEKARLNVDVANTAIAEGDYISALQSLARAEALDSKIPELHLSKSIAYYFRNDSAKAIESARRAVELKPDFSEALNMLGKLLMDSGKLDQAEAPLTKAVHDSLYRESYKAATNLGILYYRQEKFDQAETYFERAIADAPIAACVAYYYRGHILLRKGKFPSAIDQYDHATQKLCAKFADAHLALGIAFERSKQYDRARKKFLDIEQNFPNTKVAEQAMDRLRFLP